MEEISLKPTLFRVHSNNGNTARMELFKFSATAGKYQLELKEGSSVSLIERGVSSLFPLKMVDVENYYIQIRESQPFYYALFGISLITLAGLFIIGGLVFSILADQLIPD